MSSDLDPLPPGLNSIAIIIPNLHTLMIGQTFSTLLIPLLMALFYYSTPDSRRQPIFILNVLALVVAFTGGVITNALCIHMMLSPQSVWPAQIPLFIAVEFIGAFQGMLADTILLVRLITVYPLNHIGLMRFALLTALPITLKIVRLTNLILYIIHLGNIAKGPNAFQEIAYGAWLAGPYVKIEWISQVVDNSYASIAFLWTIQRFRADTTSDGSVGAVAFHQSSFAGRVRVLFNLALSNFIIPTIFSIAQVALTFRLGNSGGTLVSDITYVNIMISVLGVAFATVWAGKERRREANLLLSPLPAEHGQCCTCKLDRWQVCENLPVAHNATMKSYRSDNASSGASHQTPGVEFIV